MDIDLSQNALLAIGLIILLVLAINLGLWAVWKRRNERQQESWLSRMSKALRAPWQAEQSNMQELTRRLTELRQDEQPAKHDSPTDPPLSTRMD